jgi:hypothetical protein
VGEDGGLVIRPFCTSHGLRSDEDEMSPPGRVEPSNGQPEESIPALEVRPRARAERDVELMAQEQVLDHEVVALM